MATLLDQNSAFVGFTGGTGGLFALQDILAWRFDSPPAEIRNDVTSSVNVNRSGFRFNQSTRRFEQTITITNSSGGAIVGPVSLVLDNLNNNATLFNKKGVTTTLVPFGIPYIALNVGTDAVLSPVRPAPCSRIHQSDQPDDQI